MLGINERDHRIQEVLLGDLVVHEERLCHGAGISQTSGFNDDAVKVDFALAFALCEVLQGGAQILTDGATHATVAHLNDVFSDVTHQNIAVNIFLTELVLDNGNFVAMGLTQNALQKRGLTGSEKAREYRCRNKRHGVRRGASPASNKETEGA